MHFQNSLPKMPIPELSDSLQRFIYSATPLVSAAQLAAAQKAADAFLKEQGPRLQAQLKATDAASYSSYISKPWFELYLKDRSPLLLNYNPQLTFKDEPGEGRSSQAGRGARLLHAAAKFLRTYEENVLEPDIFHTNPKRSKHPLWPEVMRMLPRSVAFYGAAATGAYPLDMSQYHNLFRSTRIPRQEIDELRKSESKSRHVVVQRGGHFWSVDVLDEAGGPVPPTQLRGALQAIIDADGAAGGAQAQTAASACALGLLTSLPRNEWASARAALAASSAVNQAALETIDSALFTLSLDRESPVGPEAVNRCMLHGDGVDRWLDKSFTLIVTANGKAAVNFEHAWGDGVAVLRFFNEVYDAASAMADERGAAPTQPPQPLSWELPAQMPAIVADAKARFDATVGSTDLAVMESDLLTTTALKKAKLSPDGMLQMSFQLAHHKMHGHAASTYESASTAAFKHGRTETIRSATPESDAFAKTFCDARASPSARAAAMRAAVDNHTRITRECLMGKGMDRHLFALRHTALANGEPVPPLFETDAYHTLAKIIISTSTLNSDALDNGGFGPVNQDCYAVGYGIRDYGCMAQVMSYKRDAPGFRDILLDALKEMRELISVK